MNGTGLVPANPETAPYQTYSRLVQDDLSVLSCADMPGVDSLPTDPAVTYPHFDGTLAPPHRLRRDGDRSIPA